MMRGKKNNKGFSLVELIVVIAIMAVLVGILAPTLIKYVDKSRRSTDVKNASEYMSAIQTYASDHEEMAGISGATIVLTTKGATISDANIQKALEDAGLTTSTDKDKDKANASMKLKSKSWGDVTISVTIGTDMQPSFTATNTTPGTNNEYNFATAAGITATSSSGGTTDGN